ncbi:hypothetical protein FHS56_002082 [Thermonema lapsum]|uniref:Carboxypeptidase-like regulatory domain-containing protein n=1 Tax=Thermonema lapsum TaxID=28195 RepID=A0A846MTK4_9BACT|nr:carboxypeptidase-like regulatory domain-containing protein [Thermonema lapsum]NIK74557.1 hypothetical protein [Thermonema lapsum]
MKKIIGALFVLIGCVAMQAQAQGISFPLTGYVIDKETEKPLVGTTILIPSANVGTVSDIDGRFQINVMPGDTLYFSHIGYERSFYVVPQDKRAPYTVRLALDVEVYQLKAVEIFPYRTELQFKEAFLSVELEDERTKLLKENLRASFVARAAYQMELDGSLNYRNYINQQTYQLHNRTFLPTLSLLNPFAWSRFIKDVKEGKYNKERMKSYEEAP